MVSAIPLLVLSSYLFVDKKKFYSAFVLVFSFIFSIVYIKFANGSEFSSTAFDLLAGYTIGITNIILFLETSLRGKIWSKIFKHTLTVMLLLPNVFIWGYYFTTGAYINVDTVLGILQTNPTEAKEYVQAFVSWKSALCVLVIAIYIRLMISLCKYNLNFSNAYKWFYVLLIMAILGNIWLVYRCRVNIISGPFIEAHKFIQTYNKFNLNKESRKSSIVVESEPNKGLYVLIVGESHSRDYSSAYGFTETTTPWLDAVKKSKNGLLFTNAYSSHVQTVPSVTYALTAKNQYNTMSLENSLSLLEVAEAAGYETVWMSNQLKFAVHDTPITAIAEEANQQFWLNEDKIKGETQNHDGTIIEKLKKMQIKENMLLVIHLMGSHADYKQRYPYEFEFFKSESALSIYKNSLLYNDYVVEQLYNELKVIPEFRALVYCSDHGEIPGVGHDTNNYDEKMTHIPFYMIFNPKYIEDNKLLVNKLKRAQDFPFTNDLIFNTMLSLMNIRLKDVYEEQNDLGADSYDSNVNRFKTLHGKTQIQSLLK